VSIGKLALEVCDAVLIGMNHFIGSGLQVSEKLDDLNARLFSTFWLLYLCVMARTRKVQ
jgi:hypothetical protein